MKRLIFVDFFLPRAVASIEATPLYIHLIQVHHGILKNITRQSINVITSDNFKSLDKCFNVGFLGNDNRILPSSPPGGN